MRRTLPTTNSAIGDWSESNVLVHNVQQQHQQDIFENRNQSNSARFVNAIHTSSGDYTHTSNQWQDQSGNENQSNTILQNNRAYAEEENIQRTYDQRRKQTSRQNETENQRTVRLVEQRQRSAKNRSNRRMQSGMTNTWKRRFHSESRRGARKQNITTQESETDNLQRQQEFLEKQRKVHLKQYSWPGVIPEQLKKSCLQNFCNRTSMSNLRESVCVVCNARAYSKLMKTCAFQDVSHKKSLCCPTDLIHVVSSTRKTINSMDISHIVSQLMSPFFIDEISSSSFFLDSDICFYKKGYDKARNIATVCQLCHKTLSANKIPAFSAANRMWIGDIPPVLQQLTIAEEKL